MLLAQSLLDQAHYVPPSGWIEYGETDGFQWQVTSELYTTGGASAPGKHPLHEVVLTIRAAEVGSNPREWQFVTLLPQRALKPGERLE